MFYLAQQYTASFGLYKSLEFTGPGAKSIVLMREINNSRPYS